MSRISERIIASVANSCGTGSVRLTNFSVCGLKARVRLSVAGTTHARKSELLALANDLFNGELRCVPGSFREESHNMDIATHVVIGLVTLNQERLMATDPRATRMKTMASNIFMDEADVVWDRHGDMLYRKNQVQSAEALEELLQCCASSTIRPVQMASGQHQGGDCIVFASQGEVHIGYVLAADHANAKLLVLATDNVDPETIDESDVVQTVPEDELDDAEGDEGQQEMSSAGTAPDKAQMIAYYKRLFGEHPEFWLALQQRISAAAFF